MKSVKELDVFKLAHEMALEIYGITRNFPEEEKFGLTSQMRRAAYSVPMNLVEGANRLNSKEYRQFVGVAKGSAAEVGYQLRLARDLGYIDHDTCQTNQISYDRICQMLTKLAKSLE
ncbi:MAG: four helix bundle protein [Deltaproteobacteria bacterium]|nr:four helix bundle protein [Deltaproteobacteria bacterium]